MLDGLDSARRTGTVDIGNPDRGAEARQRLGKMPSQAATCASNQKISIAEIVLDCRRHQTILWI
jgi:hypothetical protein